MGTMKKVSILLMVGIVCALCILPNVKGKKRGTSKSVVNNAKTALKTEYSKKSGVSGVSVSGTETKQNSQNYDQSVLRKYYNNNNGTAKDLTDGICWCAATTSLLKFFKVSKGKDELAKSLIEQALSKGWISATDTGMSAWDHDDLVTFGFTNNSIKKEGNLDFYGIYDTLKSEVDNGRVVLFMVEDHTMTGCGYVQYTVNYTKTNSKGKKTSESDKVDYVIVNDTWSDSRQYSYFPEDEIGTNIFTRWGFGIVKVLNK